MGYGFKFHKNILGLPTPESEKIIIKASETVKVGGLVRKEAGFIAPVGAGESIFGLCEGFITKDGIPLERANAADYDGTFTDGIWGVKSYAAASDNQTDKQVKAIVRPLSHYDVLSAWPDATIGRIVPIIQNYACSCAL